jgi:hypothetical protein
MQLAARRFKKFRPRPLLLGIDPIVVMKDIAGAGQNRHRLGRLGAGRR